MSKDPNGLNHMVKKGSGHSRQREPQVQRPVDGERLDPAQSSRKITGCCVENCLDGTRRGENRTEAEPGSEASLGVSRGGCGKKGEK